MLSRLRRTIGLSRRRAGDRLRGKAKWNVLRGRDPVCLYAGNVPASDLYDKFIGLSLWKSDDRHIRHDIRRPHGLPAGTVDIYQAEDVFEHIDLRRLPAVIADIHRILKPGGLFRLSVPDYRCDLLAARSLKDGRGRIVFDPGGGGALKGTRVVGGGHLWFPVYETVCGLLEGSPFRNAFTFHHYYDEGGKAVLRPIDYSLGYVKRTPDHDPRVRDPYRPLSIVVDAVKRG
jgi:hypothetical protein